MQQNFFEVFKVYFLFFNRHLHKRAVFLINTLGIF